MREATVLMPVRTWLKTKFREIALDGSNLPVAAMKYIPYKNGSSAYAIAKKPDNGQDLCKLGLPIPPEDLWLGYGTNPGEYLSSGEAHAANMLDIVAKSEFSFGTGDRILDFGCGAGRMVRQLKNLAETCEIWGTDINSSAIYWCKQHMEPPFHFFTTLTNPHLPFKDGYFDFIYSGSVFTHIDDLADAWLLELRRVLSPKGRLYITIHDNRTMELLETTYDHTWLSKLIRSSDFYCAFRSVGGKIVLGRDADSQVFYDISYFSKILESMYEVVSVTPEAYDYQTGVLLRHKSIEKARR